ncbi:MAG: hypothetical protein IJZ54_04980 [Clostridia bacterium]|nr:hypothetical protein [Clostridia bacterium]
MTKTKPTPIILILTAAANYLPIIFGLIFYFLGFEVFVALFCFQKILTILNFFVSNNIRQLLILSANLMISTIATTLLTTYLYMAKISPDSGTLLVGQIALVAGCIVVAVFAAIACLIKFRINS